MQHNDNDKGQKLSHDLDCGSERSSEDPENRLDQTQLLFLSFAKLNDRSFSHIISFKHCQKVPCLKCGTSY